MNYDIKNSIKISNTDVEVVIYEYVGFYDIYVNNSKYKIVVSEGSFVLVPQDVSGINQYAELSMAVEEAVVFKTGDHDIAMSVRLEFELIQLQDITSDIVKEIKFINDSSSEISVSGNDEDVVTLIKADLTNALNKIKAIVMT